MNTRSALLLAILTIVPTVGTAQQSDQKVGVVSSKELGKVAEQRSTQLTATVQAVDPATRTVTLKGPEGNLVKVVAGDEVRNFDQIRVGDRVEVSHTVGLVLQLVKGGGGVRTRIESENTTRGAKGEKPTGTAMREVMAVADVVRVDREKQMITLRGPERTVELRVRDSAQLENIAAGDQVEATFTEAMAISVKAARDEK